MSEAATAAVRSVVLTLLVAGETAASRSARANLETLIGEGLADAASSRVVDVLVQPDYALRFRAFLTPALIVETGERTTTVVGDLRELDEVRLLIGTQVH
ncbi:circadian clock KaiB family protein [Herbiconiux liukaitaii]|uniref:circadian clock KaiB family protein n=1 Tax=Herbiconiux liukaitaii TaxID=3342799 RepID=UPI0035B7CBBD